jgi:hypothetical protein
MEAAEQLANQHRQGDRGRQHQWRLAEQVVQHQAVESPQPAGDGEEENAGGA